MLQADDYDDINDDELKDLVQKWAMKKMATQFQTWNKIPIHEIRQEEPDAQFQY